MLRQTPDGLAIIGDYHHFAAIRLTPEEISERHTVRWERYDEDGLGRAAIAGFYDSADGYYMLRYLYQAPVLATTMMILGDVKDPESKIEEVCEDFGFTQSDLVWIRPDLKFRNFDLFRQDDNGSDYHVARFPFRPDAQAKLKELAKGGHKQFYEIRRAATDTLEIATDAEGMLVKTNGEQSGAVRPLSR